MELRSNVFSDILSPLYAFASVDTEEPNSDADEKPAQGAEPWETSFTNPQSRIDSLTPRSHPGWQLDGVDIDGRRFFVVPRFVVGLPPLRIDVYIPPLEDQPRAVRELLKSAAAMYVKGTANLPISQHLLRALERWQRRTPNFQRQYIGVPFGSQIVVTSLACKLDEVDIHLIQNYDVERSMQTVDGLQQMWDLPLSSWPEVVDWTELQFRQQLHEAITLVEIPSRGESNRAVVFKSLVRDQKYMYNELKMLLTLSPHPNVIAKPLYVVTKRCRFGGKYGVCGFILEYYPLGSLKERLSDALSGAAPPITVQERLRWSCQITRALIHINSHCPFGLYPDLKPDNIVLTESSSSSYHGREAGRKQVDAVLIDLEQRGGWFSWSPPEVAHVEYMEILAAGLEGDKNAPMREEATRQLQAYMPGWTPSTQNDRYEDADGGFSEPWRALMRTRQSGGGHRGDMLERAQVFMLGKMLWCIFEGQPFVRCGIDHELLRDNNINNNTAAGPDHRGSERPLAFPDFRSAAPQIRSLIRRCTSGAPEWEGRRRGIVLRGGKLQPFERGSEARGPCSVRETQEVARKWWGEEVRRARKVMEELLDMERDDRGGGSSSGSLLEQIAKRPLLAGVLDELTRAGHQYSSATSGNEE